MRPATRRLDGGPVLSTPHAFFRVERLYREASILAGLRHPNIVAVHDELRHEERALALDPADPDAREAARLRAAAP
jgi:hypothetical protein